MGVTITENQHLAIKKKVRKFYLKTKANNPEPICAVKDILAPSVDKWSLFCLYNLAFNRVLRFNELKGYIPEISSRMLSVTLKKLEAAKLIKRKVYPEVPPRVEYRLTKFGHGFANKLLDINLWVFENRE